jgi:hypothetical protein
MIINIRTISFKTLTKRDNQHIMLVNVLNEVAFMLIIMLVNVLNEIAFMLIIMLVNVLNEIAFMLIITFS